MICNTGVGLTPRLDGEVLEFQEQGLYDGLFLMADTKTGTYWSHLTGEALHGPLAGEKLPVEPVVHTTVAQALAQDPRTRVALSEHPRATPRRGPAGTLKQLLDRIRGVPDGFSATMGAEDDRRPRMEMGLGLWTRDGEALYVPLETVEARDRWLVDTFGGHRVLVYHDPTARSLQALYTDAGSARWEDDVLHLSTGARIEDGVLLGPDGTRLPVERPLQVFTRWYGFSLSFPGTGVLEPPG